MAVKKPTLSAGQLATAIMGLEAKKLASDVEMSPSGTPTRMAMSTSIAAGGFRWFGICQ